MNEPKNPNYLFWLLAAGAGVLAFFFSIGLLTFLLDERIGSFVPKSSGDGASWIQAIGSIAAIIGSYVVGKSQADRAHESALALYEQQRIDAEREREILNAEAETNSRSAIAESAAAMKRISNRAAALVNWIDRKAKRYQVASREHATAVEAYERSLGDFSEGWKTAREEANVGAAQTEMEIARADLVSTVESIESVISSLTIAPRGMIAITRSDLAKLIIEAIDSLNMAAFEIEHSHERAHIIKWLKHAADALSNYCLRLVPSAPDSNVSGGQTSSA